MEVHAHTHLASGETHTVPIAIGRKKWTHHLWEFLMLFLAVFCGFLAENQREHIIEHKRAKEYAKSLLADLQNDTADLNRASFYLRTANLMIDSLIEFENDKSESKKGGQFYYYLRLASWGYNVDWNKATINQLINSGNLRYFRNTQLVTKISVYNTTSNTISVVEELIQSARERAATYRDAFLNSKYSLLFSKINMDDLYNRSNSKFIDSLKNVSIPLYNNDPDLQNKHANAIIGLKGNRNFLTTKYYPKAVNQATEIMELLKKEYHLE